MSDVLLVSGIVLLAFSVTGWLAAFAENWWRWSSVIGAGLALILIAVAWVTHPGGYPPAEAARAFVRVLAMIVN